mmetsp:Transcript_23577/g.51737  ORF Transcript_23577/g.51737 Transcript_23577/m.51737 type:complete len:258 (+) Transcript_23577:498-1271(+)
MIANCCTASYSFMCLPARPPLLLGCLDLIGPQGLAGRVVDNIVDGGCRDVVQGLLGEEGAVRGDQHLGVRGQRLELAVPALHALGGLVDGEVLKEKTTFFLIGVQAQSSNAPALQCVKQRTRLNETPPADVDDHDALLHGGNPVPVDDVLGGGQQGAVQRHDVALGQQLLQAEVGDAQGLDLGVLKHIIRQHRAPNALEYPARLVADCPGTDDPHCLVVHLVAHQPRQAVVALQHPQVCNVQVPVEGEHEGNSVLRH